MIINNKLVHCVFSLDKFLQVLIVLVIVNSEEAYYFMEMETIQILTKCLSLQS